MGPGRLRMGGGAAGGVVVFGEGSGVGGGVRAVRRDRRDCKTWKLPWLPPRAEMTRLPWRQEERRTESGTGTRPALQHKVFSSVPQCPQVRGSDLLFVNTWARITAFEST